MTNHNRVRLRVGEWVNTVYCYTSDGNICNFSYDPKPKEHTYEWAKNKLEEHIKELGLTILDK